MRMVKWRKELLKINDVLMMHESVIKEVWVIPLPSDVVSLILLKLQRYKQREFTNGIRHLLEGLGDETRISQDVAFARQNAVYSLIHACCLYNNASLWHLRALPNLWKSIILKFEELVNIVRDQQKKRKYLTERRLQKLSHRWKDVQSFL